MELETHYADSDGVNIAYQVHGDGPLDLVFVPGFVSHVELLWEEPAIARFLRRLASFSRLVVFDKRGQGLSDRPGRPPTLEESMDDLKAVMEAAGCERPAIFGISEGGPMSALFAATYPGPGLLAGPLRDLRADARGAATSRTGSATKRSTAGVEMVRARVGRRRSASTSGRRAASATASSNAGGRGCCARGRARPGRSR